MPNKNQYRSIPHRLFRTLLFAALSCGIFCGVSRTAIAQETAVEPVAETTGEPAADLPEARAILEQHLEATGGRENVEKIKSVIMLGEIDIPALKAKANVTVTQIEDRLLFETEIPGIGELKKCVDGEMAWEINPLMGTRLIKGEELAPLLKEADLKASLNLDKYYESMKCVAKTDIDGKPCYELEMVTKEGAVERNFYDVDSKMMVQTIRKQKTPLGDIEMTSKLSDFRESGDMTFPFHAETTYMGQSEIIKTNSITVNGDVDESIFETPEEVQKLIAKDQKKAAENEAAENEAAENEAETEAQSEDDE